MKRKEPQHIEPWIEDATGVGKPFLVTEFNVIVSLPEATMNILEAGYAPNARNSCSGEVQVQST